MGEGNKMIAQHYYTRDRKGVFSKTPGYDTVAKSSELENEFIINTLQELCFYEVPSPLVGEEDIFKYPAALFYANVENKMIIGQSVFGGKDYTGQRNRYFTHNYIIPEKEREIYIENPEKIIYASGFKRDYDIEKGSMLQQIREIPLDNRDNCFNSIENMFSATGINTEIFTSLIKACFKSVKYCRKIYIVLNVDYSHINTVSRGILKYLYRVLPFEVRRNLGFITYMKEPKLKDSINIIFLARGSIKRLSTEIKAGYVFDLSKKDFYLDDIGEEKHEFIEFVMDNIENTENLKKFFSRADSTLLGGRLNICEYDEFFKEPPQKKKEAPCENTIIPVENKNNNFFLKGILKKILDFFKN